MNTRAKARNADAPSPERKHEAASPPKLIATAAVTQAPDGTAILQVQLPITLESTYRHFATIRVGDETLRISKREPALASAHIPIGHLIQSR